MHTRRPLPRVVYHSGKYDRVIDVYLEGGVQPVQFTYLPELPDLLKECGFDLELRREILRQTCVQVEFSK